MVFFFFFLRNEGVVHDIILNKTELSGPTGKVDDFVVTSCV